MNHINPVILCKVVEDLQTAISDPLRTGGEIVHHPLSRHAVFCGGLAKSSVPLAISSVQTTNLVQD